MTNKNYDYSHQKKREEQKAVNKKKAIQYRHNLQSRSRSKDWQRYDDNEIEEIVTQPVERIMARDENDRRRRVQNSALAGQGLNHGLVRQHDGTHGIVAEISTGICRVHVDGREMICAIRGSLTAQETGFSNAVAVGDEVIISPQPDGNGIIESVQPRRSILTRSDGPRQQLMVANADQLLIVAAWRNPHIWPEMIDRYLIVAERNHLPAVLCINKIDLAEDAAELERFAALYRSLQVEVVLTSVTQSTGIDWLRETLHDKMTVLTGLSGVGKSSLLSAVHPGLHLKAKTVSEFSGEGRHTTTQSNLYMVPGGGAVVDTPGIREFGLRGLTPRGLADFFPEFHWFSDTCRFANCLHRDEPGCAVRQAVNSGNIAQTRYHSYQRITEELFPNSR